MSSIKKSEFRRGMILMWSGTIATIPGGWVLCNGSNSTPDLRNRFVICADADDAGAAKTTVEGAASQSGGAATKNLAHTHDVSGTTGAAPDQGNRYDGSTSPLSVPGHTHSFSATSTSGGSATQNVMNPYYALAYIMKV